MDSKFDTIKTSLNKIDNTNTTLGDHINELKQSMSSNEDEIQTLFNLVRKLEKDQAHLKKQAEDAENRSQAYNLQFISIPEKAKGEDICGFMNRLISKLLGMENFPTPPVIQNCDRNPTFLKKKTPELGQERSRSDSSIFRTSPR